VNLFPELLDGAEYLLMFIEEVEKLFEHLGDIFINPVLVLEFDYDAVSIDICKVLLANFDLFEAIEKHQHDPHDFLRVEIIEDLADLFDDSPVVILKILLAVLVETQYPEHGHDVVGDLWLAEAWSLKQFANHVEAGAVDEYFGEIIALQKSHESKGVGVDRDAKLIDITLDNNPVKELFRTLFNFLELRLLSVPNGEECQEVGGDVSLYFIFDLVSVQKAIQDRNNVNWILEVVHQGEECLNSGSLILQNAIEMGQAVVDELVITGDMLDDLHKTANSVYGLLLIAWFVKEESLLLIVRQQEFSQNLGRSLGNQATAFFLLYLLHFFVDVDAVAEVLSLGRTH